MYVDTLKLILIYFFAVVLCYAVTVSHLVVVWSNAVA